MSVTANDKGAVEQRVNLIKRGKGQIQHVMLHSVLIKKAENYGLMTDRFITNHFAPVMQDTRTLMTFHPRRDIGVADTGFGVAPDEAFLDRLNEFRVSPMFSTARLCEALATFVREFNFALYTQGANYNQFGALITRHQILQNKDANPLGHHPYDLGNQIDKDDVGYTVNIHDVYPFVALGFTHDGNIQLSMSHHFLSQFYIELDEVFAKQVGLPVLIYAHDNQAGIITLSNQVNAPPLFFGNQLFALDPDIHATANGLPRTIESTKSIFNCDDRLSVDIEISLPLAQSIDVHNGSEQHTYLLNRYMITDYVTVEGRTQQKGGHILTKSIIHDKLSAGFTDLVHNQPSSHTAQLLNGKIQEMDLRLMLRYKKFSVVDERLKFTIERVPMELDDSGVYDLLLAFNKRV